jgi:outer membrane receptor for ferrienterochelin and colicins
MKQLLAVLFAFSLTSTPAFGQQPTIVGKVYDGTSKDAIISARITFDPEFLHDSVRTKVKGKGAKSQEDGSFSLAAPDTGTFVLEIKQPGYDVGYVEFQAKISHSDTLIAYLEREQNDAVVVTAQATSRTVEDLCCRVEELNAELTRVAAFTPDMQQVMSRYSTCTSYHINCTLDHSQSVRLRGLSNSSTLMLIDGAPLFSAITSQYGIQMIPALATANARIIEGASTTVYGNNALAGVLSFDLKQPTGTRELFLQSNLASGISEQLEGAYDLNVGYRDATENLGVAAVVSYNSHPMESITNAFEGGAPGLKRYSGYLTAEHMSSGGTKLRATVLGGRDGRLLSLEQGDKSNLQEVKTEALNAIIKLDNPLSDLSQLTLTGGLSVASHNVAATGTDFSLSPLSLRSNVMYFQGLYTLGAGDHYITSGVELRPERAYGTLGGERSTPDDLIYSFNTISAFAEDQIALGETWTLLAGARLDRHSTAGFAVSPRASLSWRPDDEWRMRLMLGQGVKGQALVDEDHRIMHRQFAYQYNDDFDFEKARTINYDFSYTYTIGEEIGGQVNFNTYYTLISGRATPSLDSLTSGKIFFVNSPEPTRLMGIEIQTRPSFNENWSGSLAFSVINVTSVNEAGVRERVALSPTINADASIMYNSDPTAFAMELWGSLIGKQRLPENPFGVSTSPVLGILNLRAQKKLGIFTLHAGILNILDSKQTNTMPVAYSSNGSIVSNLGFAPMEGREAFAGFRIDL